MKIQKTISLTTDTAKIAATIEPNFSQWVRIGLRAHRNHQSLASEISARIRWAQCAHYLASYIEQLDTTDLTAQQVMQLADAHAKKQMTLEEFE